MKGEQGTQILMILMIITDLNNHNDLCSLLIPILLPLPCTVPLPGIHAVVVGSGVNRPAGIRTLDDRIAGQAATGIAGSLEAVVDGATLAFIFIAGVTCLQYHKACQYH